MRVMVAVDGSEGSFYALKWVLDTLFPSGGGSATAELNQDLGTVTVVHVQQPFHPYIYPAGPVVHATTPTVMESVRKAQQQNAIDIFSRAMRMGQGKRVKVETLLLEGEPKEMICEAAEKVEVDLLVVGSRGLSKIKRIFLGSVSDHCAHHAKCAVLLVRPPPPSESKE